MICAPPRSRRTWCARNAMVRRCQLGGVAKHRFSKSRGRRFQTKTEPPRGLVAHVFRFEHKRARFDHTAVALAQENQIERRRPTKRRRATRSFPDDHRPGPAKLRSQFVNQLADGLGLLLSKDRAYEAPYQIAREGFIGSTDKFSLNAQRDCLQGVLGRNPYVQIAKRVELWPAGLEPVHAILLARLFKMKPLPEARLNGFIEVHPQI